MAGVNVEGKCGFQRQFTYEDIDKALRKWRSDITKMVKDEETPGIIREHLTDDEIMQRTGLSPATLQRMYSGADGYAEFKPLFEKVIAFRERICARYVDKGVGWVFTAKQGRWGGWQDVQRSESKSSSKIEITLNGADGKPLKIGR